MQGRATRIIHSLGGCGGTLVSRCLGVLPGVAIFSEINPLSVTFYSELNPLYQDQKWLHLLSPEDLARFGSLDLSDFSNFRELFQVLQTRAEEQGRILILRDYNYAEYLGVPFLARPPMRMVLYDAVPNPVRAIALVRHPVDQWASLRKHMIARRSALSAWEFAEAYAAFVRDLGNTPIFRYEDFVADSEKELRRICDCLEVPFDAAFRDSFDRFDQVTGNLTRQAETTISMKAPRPVSEEDLDDFQSHARLCQTATRLQYDEIRPGRSFSDPKEGVPRGAERLERQVEGLRRGEVEWISEIRAKEEELRAIHAEAERRRVELERAVAAIREWEQAGLRVPFLATVRRWKESLWRALTCSAGSRSG